MHRAQALTLFSVFLAIVLTIGLASSAHAQLASTDNISLDVEPEYPMPYQTVTITPSSDVIDLSSAEVSATVNGTSVYKGTGGAPIQVTVNGPGSKSTVVIKAVSAGQTYTQEIVLQPENVALVVEPVSTTHPFYEGEGLVTSQGEVRLIAVPDMRSSSGAELNPSNLEYTWKLGDQILEEDSGIGDSVLDATAPEQYRDADITVTVSDPNGTEIAQAATNITPTDPFVRIYENDALEGPLYDNALSDTYVMSGSEDTFRAVPYYFSETPSVNWTIDGTQSGTTNDLTVSASGSGQGTAVLQFSANQPDDSISADTTISVNYGQNQSGGILGL